MHQKLKSKVNLQEYIQKGVDFDTYLQQTEKVAEAGTDELVEYYVINLARMRRIYKTVNPEEQQKQELLGINQKITFLVISEGWCGDAAQIIPVVAKMVDASENLELSIVYRDENPELMDEYLTNGSRSIPIIIGVDENGNEIMKYGPRPKWGEPILQAYKDGEFSKEEFLLTLQKTYTRDRGVSIINEILEHLRTNHE
ncbi:MAG: thioredoxin family protein [Weeksellaceae bacterium]|nr:thioredoxin family protein [Weeksellaceae bacterium]